MITGDQIREVRKLLNLPQLGVAFGFEMMQPFLSPESDGEWRATVKLDRRDSRDPLKAFSSSAGRPNK
jgi:hypothetical protein